MALDEFPPAASRMLTAQSASGLCASGCAGCARRSTGPRRSAKPGSLSGRQNGSSGGESATGWRCDSPNSREEHGHQTRGRDPQDSSVARPSQGQEPPGEWALAARAVVRSVPLGQERVGPSRALRLEKVCCRASRSTLVSTRPTSGGWRECPALCRGLYVQQP